MTFLLSLFFAVLVSSTMGLPLRWVSSPSASSAGASLSWAPAVLGLFQGCFSQVKSKSRHHRCQANVVSSVLSHLNKNLKQRTLKPSARHSSWTDRVIALGSQTDLVIALRSVLQLRVTAQFSLEKSKKTHPQGVRACQPKVVKRERET